MGLYDRSRKSQVLFKSFACRSTSPTKCVGQELQNREFDAMGTQMGDRLHSLSLSIAEHKKELEQFTSAQMPAKLEVSSKQTAINFHNDLVGLADVVCQEAATTLHATKDAEQRCELEVRQAAKKRDLLEHIFDECFVPLRDDERLSSDLAQEHLAKVHHIMRRCRCEEALLKSFATSAYHRPGKRGQFCHSAVTMVQSQLESLMCFAKEECSKLAKELQEFQNKVGKAQVAYVRARADLDVLHAGLNILMQQLQEALQHHASSKKALQDVQDCIRHLEGEIHQIESDQHDCQ